MNILAHASGALFRKDLVTTWPELLARAPSYFKRYGRQHPHFKMMSKEMQAHGHLSCIVGMRRAVACGASSLWIFCFDFLPRFGKLVLMELQQVAPQPGDQASNFLKFLIKVFRESEAPLKLES